MLPKDIAETGLILKSVVGSTLHGTSIGGSDRDEMGVCIEPPDKVFSGNFEQHQYRNKAEGEKSQPGDVEGTIYSLRKYIALTTKGNPTVLELLFAPSDYLIFQNEIGYELQQLRSAICSQQALPAFAGYLKAQRLRLTGEKRGHVPSRPELVEKFGFDTKYAGHAVRLGIMGWQYAVTGKIPLPMYKEDAQPIKNIRNGEVSYKRVLQIIENLEAALLVKKESYDGPLPEYPDWEKINEFLLHAYTLMWKREYGLAF